MAQRKRWSFWKPPLEHISILWLDDLHRGRLTIGGRVLLWGGAAVGTMLLGGLAESLVYGFGFCVSSLLLATIVGLPFRPRLRMKRHVTAFPSVGEVFTYRVNVENTGRRVARHIVVEERGLPSDIRPVGDAPTIEALAPGVCVSVTMQLKCLRRGAYELAYLQGASSYPTGLFKSGRKLRRTDRLLVYPRVVEVGTFDIPRARNYQPGGIAMASHVGESTEFLGTRDWRTGDRLRDIHWPSTARVGRLITKEFQEEYFVRLAVVLDVETRSARDELQLEQAISLTAGITDVLARMEYIVDIFAAGDDVYHFKAGRALAHLDNILEILACLDSGRRLDMQALESALLPETPRLSAVVFVMMDWDRARADMVQLLKSHGLAVRVVCMRKGRRQEGLEQSEVVEAPA
jgi:uncharacterized repeat protein (TIGR01451 family)